MNLDSVCTARLRGERMTMAHLPDIRRMHQNEDFMAYLGGVRTEEETVSYLERNVAHWDEHGFGMWVLCARATGELMGRGGLRHLDVHGADEIVIGYAFFPEFWGRGFATEIARTCVAIARDRLGPESVVSDALPTNAASRRVMVKAGLVYERDVTLDGIPLVLYRSPPLSSWALDEVYEL